MGRGQGGTTYVSQSKKEFWIKTFLGWFSIVPHVFSWAALFYNTVKTLLEYEDSYGGGRPAIFDTDFLNTFYW